MFHCIPISIPTQQHLTSCTECWKDLIILEPIAKLGSPLVRYRFEASMKNRKYYSRFLNMYYWCKQNDRCIYDQQGQVKYPWMKQLNEIMGVCNVRNAVFHNSQLGHFKGKGCMVEMGHEARRLHSGAVWPGWLSGNRHPGPIIILKRFLSDCTHLRPSHALRALSEP